jgi:hypothetical protein
VSLLTGRHAIILPQFVVFEVTYVLQSLYRVTGKRLASMIRDLLSFPGVVTLPAG